MPHRRSARRDPGRSAASHVARHLLEGRTLFGSISGPHQTVRLSLDRGVTAPAWSEKAARDGRVRISLSLNVPSSAGDEIPRRPHRLERRPLLAPARAASASAWFGKRSAGSCAFGRAELVRFARSAGAHRRRRPPGLARVWNRGKHVHARYREPEGRLALCRSSAAARVAGDLPGRGRRSTM